jgi:hypothetical protein
MGFLDHVYSDHKRSSLILTIVGSIMLGCSDVVRSPSAWQEPDEVALYVFLSIVIFVTFWVRNESKSIVWKR